MQLVAEFAASGLEQKEFVAKHDVSLGTFQYWLYEKSKRASVQLSNSEATSRPAFLPLEVVASPAPKAREEMAGLLEARCASGLAVRFAVGTDVGYVAALLRALA
ncbi:IS66 family insertion sequence element accessory protein TnpB [Aggregicoccus sp. 17bor-14]|uniref:IS66 family insertion sequence element accessory protein TnpA n=1 Tax=Myxococcaceae TaxID=31 RepID=UPI00129C8552|nr:MULTISPECIES: IS66 family insertion sequence element accessory protein TnpB [Myxococcaceae]MBF5046399.1 IS66 family insertion sequence element accessory protein TnpB [Simulacricoccus sp. 17bor-14]MRI92119.1 IS66 family insertion sequence element accessory protein TnpB [Aggregicoccus sp. 17bor-14]